MERLALACISLLLFFPMLAGAQTKPEVTGPHTWSFSSDEQYQCEPHNAWIVPKIQILSIDGGVMSIGQHLSEMSLNITHPNNASRVFMVHGLVKVYQPVRVGACGGQLTLGAFGTMIAMGFSNDDISIPNKHYSLQLQISDGPSIDCFLDATTLTGPCYSSLQIPGKATFVPK